MATVNGAPEGYKMDRYGRLRVTEVRLDYGVHDKRPYQYACETVNRRTR